MQQRLSNYNKYTIEKDKRDRVKQISHITHGFPYFKQYAKPIYVKKYIQYMQCKIPLHCMLYKSTMLCKKQGFYIYNYVQKKNKIIIIQKTASSLIVFIVPDKWEYLRTILGYFFSLQETMVFSLIKLRDGSTKGFNTTVSMENKQNGYYPQRSQITPAFLQLCEQKCNSSIC